MSKTLIRRFSYLDHQIEIIRERSNLPTVSPLEARPGIQVRYGLKFDGQLTDWSGFVEGTEDEPSVNNLAELGVLRARTVSKSERAVAVSPAA